MSNFYRATAPSRNVAATRRMGRGQPDPQPTPQPPHRPALAGSRASISGLASPRECGGQAMGRGRTGIVFTQHFTLRSKALAQPDASAERKNATGLDVAPLTSAWNYDFSPRSVAEKWILGQFENDGRGPALAVTINKKAPKRKAGQPMPPARRSRREIVHRIIQLSIAAFDARSAEGPKAHR